VRSRGDCLAGNRVKFDRSLLPAKGRLVGSVSRRTQLPINHVLSVTTRRNRLKQDTAGQDV